VSSQNTVSVTPLPASVARMIDGADGWLMLGNSAEALIEFGQVPDEFLDHPAVLALEWKAATAAGKMAQAWIAAKKLCERFPDLPVPWICQANALRELRGPQAAADLLLSVVCQFVANPVLLYNIACFLVQDGQWERACSWLLRAFEAEDGAQLKQLALLDPDLKPLWEKIGENFDISVYSIACGGESGETAATGLDRGR
jgi:hypothetical protein